MEYIALYRKYRPRTFSDVIGQENVVAILKNQITMKKVAHAYLFSGTRGTGKTSVAKIFARGVNCPESVGGEPCNKCRACLEMETSSVMDIIEIDAASNRGVDEIRELRDKVKYMPVIGEYKVYIIDEVHMLTTEAFNALLKTLEEPPSHVIFILATTEPNKLPATILSRCQRYHFKRLTQEQIIARLEHVAKDIQVEVEEAAMQLIAKNADGAMRDALSILDQCISISSDSKITYDEVRETLGITDNEIVFSLMEGLLQKDAPRALEDLDKAYTEGKEMTRLIHQIIAGFRDLLIYDITRNMSLLMEIKDESMELLHSIGPEDHGFIAQVIDVFSERESKLKFTALPKVLMEVTLVYLCSLDRNAPVSTAYGQEPKGRRSEGKQPQRKAEAVPPKRAQPKGADESRPVASSKVMEGAPRKPETSTKKAGKAFSQFRRQVFKEKKVMGGTLASARGEMEGDVLTITFMKGEDFAYRMASEDLKYLQDTAKKLFGETAQIQLEMEKKETDFMKSLPIEIFGEDKVEFK